MRGYGNEPVRLPLVEKKRGLIFVARSELSKPISLRPSDVYSFDAKLFAKLRLAYEQGKEAELNRLWARADSYAD